VHQCRLPELYLPWEGAGGVWVGLGRAGKGHRRAPFCTLGRSTTSCYALGGHWDLRPYDKAAPGESREQRKPWKEPWMLFWIYPWAPWTQPWRWP